ncbi:MAG: hypothetical protein QXP72_04640 [Desulfurococcaceae archaeon]
MIRICKLEKLLEGECFQYNSMVWFVKGFQHPSGYVVAYPRYNLLNKAKVSDFRNVYWDCIKQNVPMVPLNGADIHIFNLKPFERDFAFELFLNCSGLCEDKVVVTGSSTVGLETGDLDIIVYGVDEDEVLEIHRSINNCFKPINESLLVKEYFEKHINDTDLTTYLFLKKNTLLHYMLGKLHVNVKYVFHDRGWNNCIDPVESVRIFKGYVEIVGALRKYALPVIYIAKHDGDEMYLWSLREIYAEIPRGIYYVEGRLELRSSGSYLVPDNGLLLKI